MPLLFVLDWNMLNMEFVCYYFMNKLDVKLDVFGPGKEYGIVG